MNYEISKRVLDFIEYQRFLCITSPDKKGIREELDYCN